MFLPDTDGTAAVPDPSQWIRFALQDRVCHNHKTQRAINEMLHQLLGLESTAASSEIATGAVMSVAGVDAVLECLAAERTKPVELFWTNVITNDTAFVFERQFRYTRC